MVDHKRKIEAVHDRKTNAVKEYRMVTKKSKGDTGAMVVTNTSTGALVSANSSDVHQITRTSNLQAPNMLLTGHSAAVHSAQISHDGTCLATASSDKSILLWDVYGDCENWAILTGHKNAVLDLAWHQDGDLFSASADQTGAMWDTHAGVRTRRFRGHTGVVNAVCANRRGDMTVVTGSDDCSARLWDVRWKDSTTELLSDYQVTSVAFSDDGTNVFTGGIDDEIKCWDIRANKVLYSLQGHTNTVTGIELSPDGCFLLSNGMDNKLICWDVRPYVQDKRLVDVFLGHSHDLQQLLLRCAWSPDGKRVACGSADRFVYVWDVDSKQLLYKLPGHAGAITQVDFHPKEPIIASCAVDKKIFLGEIKL